MSIGDGLATARQHIRDTLATVTTANGYAVTIKSTDGGLNENPLKSADSLLPRAFVYTDACRMKAGERFGERKVTAPVYVDIWFLTGMSKGNGEEHEVLLDAAVTAITASTIPAGVRITLADEDCTYGATAGGRAILRIPFTIEAKYSLR